MKKVLAGLLVLVMVVGLVACGGTTTTTAGGEKKEIIMLSQGASPSSTSFYTFSAAIAEAVMSVYPHVNITLTETGGAADCAMQIVSGSVDFGIDASVIDYQVYYGEASFKDKGNKDARVLFWTNPLLCSLQIAVAADSGINSIEDLAGKKFCTGSNGTAVELLVNNILELNGIKVDKHIAVLADAVEAFSNREIVGVAVGGSNYDSTIVQMNSSRKIKLIGLTKEQVVKALEAMPYYIEYIIPAGTYEFQDEDIITIGLPAGCQSSAKMSQEAGYLICSAIFKGKGLDIILNAFPLGDGDWAETTLQSCIPLHAGTVQYLVEQGYDVPPELIPPEYVPVNK